MRKIKKLCNVLIILTIICSLSGCWSQEELEDRAYIIGLGIDRSKFKGKIKVTMLIANPEVGSMQGGGGSIEKPREIISFDTNDFITAKATANAIISRNISYELLKVIIVSEEFAKEKDFISIMYDTLKDREIRMNSYLAVCKEKASEYFLRNKPKMETRPHKYFQFMIEHGVENGLIPDSTLFRFFTTMDRGTDLFLAMYTTAEREKNPNVKGRNAYIAGEVNASGELDDTQFIGSAVFKNGVMIDNLSGTETRMVNILDETTNIQDVLVNFPDPFAKKDRQITARMMKTDPNTIKMNVKGAIPKIFLTVPLKIEIMTNPSQVNYAKDQEKQHILKKKMEDYVTTLFEEFLKKTQTELKGSPYPLAMYSRKYFKTTQEFEQFNWVKSYPKADISVKLNIEIIDFGVQKKAIKKWGA